MKHGPGLHMGGMKKKLATFEIAFKSKRKIAEGTYEFTFEKPAGIHFSAGQHVRMTLIDPPEMDAEGDKRFFTMASTPQESDLMFAWRVRDTAFKRVMNNMQPGQKVIVQKLLGETPKGSFVLHDDVNIPAVFVVGGIGIVPAYAMIKDALQRGLTHKMYLFYSNRRPEDAPYLAELQAFAKQNPNLKVIPTMTEPEKSAQKWLGETGFITRALLEKYLPDVHVPIYYVSGLSEMVTAMQDVLAGAGVSKDTIRAEEFAGFKMGEGMNHSGDISGGSGKSKKHLLIAAVVLFVLLMMVVHIAGGDSLSYFNLLSDASFKNPLAYLIICLMLAAIVFKLFVTVRLKNALRAKRQGEKMSVTDIVQAHKPARKNKL